jgi:hypothetical protein
LQPTKPHQGAYNHPYLPGTSPSRIFRKDTHKKTNRTTKPTPTISKDKLHIKHNGKRKHILIILAYTVAYTTIALYSPYFRSSLNTKFNVKTSLNLNGSEVSSLSRFSIIGFGGGDCTNLNRITTAKTADTHVKIRNKRY